ncbi:hypothetical protein ANCDUO_15055 [Ancylostoma duodenale]|uniref:Uncharacterized protein n=1 Tax=Ancylostoma duodenale TaxID=51022 RepID=A0A0C2GCN4_9BILA|nr:hypothetical protein ANCDUO_15055 [Ancylostoma duodenale]
MEKKTHDANETVLNHLKDHLVPGRSPNGNRLRKSSDRGRTQTLPGSHAPGLFISFVFSVEQAQKFTGIKEVHIWGREYSNSYGVVEYSQRRLGVLIPEDRLALDTLIGTPHNLEMEARAALNAIDMVLTTDPHQLKRVSHNAMERRQEIAVNEDVRGSLQ